MYKCMGLGNYDMIQGYHGFESENIVERLAELWHVGSLFHSTGLHRDSPSPLEGYLKLCLYSNHLLETPHGVPSQQFRASGGRSHVLV